MSLIQIRKRILSVETIHHEGGPAPAVPLRMVAAGAVVRNPYAGRYEPDLLPFMKELRGLDRSREIMGKLIAPRLPNPAFQLFSQLSRQERCVPESAKGEEVVPVGMHRLRRIPLMADRRREQSIERTFLRRQEIEIGVLSGPPLLAKGIEILRGREHSWPVPLGHLSIPRVAVELRRTAGEKLVAHAVEVSLLYKLTPEFSR